MSFILDALRRAETERRQGRVPDLQSVPVAQLPGGPAGSAASGWHRWLLPGAAGAALLVGLAWWFARDGTPAPLREPAPLPVQPIGRADDPPRTSPMPTPMPIVPASAPLAAAAPQRPTAPPPATTTPSAAARPGAERTAAGADAAAAPASATSSAPTKAATASAKASATAARVPALNELPDDLRRAVPPLNVSGASYSDTPANRLLFLNGQLLREGDALTPDLTLESIQLRGAILVVRGQRFRISY